MINSSQAVHTRQLNQHLNDQLITLQKNSLLKTIDRGAGADVNATENDGWTPLMEATFGNRYSLVDLLLTNGGFAKITDCDISFFTGLKDCMMHKGANVDATETDGWTAMMGAAYWGHKNIAVLLVDSGT